MNQDQTDPRRARCRAILAQLFIEWDKHATGSIEYRAAIVKNEKSWRTIVTLFTPLQPDTTSDANIRADYGDVLITAGTLPLDEAKVTVQRVVENDELILPNAPPVALSAYLQETSVSRCGSQYRHYPVSFPTTEYRFYVSDERRANVPHGMVTAPNLPLFPHTYAAIEHYLGIRLANQGAQHTEFVALVPDYRARIEKVHLATSASRVHIETLPSDRRVIGKTYYEDHTGRAHHNDLAFSDNIATIPTDGFPRTMLIVLLSPNGDMIDQWRFDANTPYTQQGVVIATSPEDIGHLIAAGESDTIEFKVQPPAAVDLAITIAAFANTSGGRIIIGVNDNAEIIGCEAAKIHDQLTNVVQDHCDPPPTFTISTRTVQDKPLVVINVPKGDDKPYNVKRKGIYVRAGATKRRATRYELDLMYTAKAHNVPWG